MLFRSKVQIRGIKELQLKFTNFNRFLGTEYNRAMVDVGKYGTRTFRSHIDSHKTESGKTFKVMTPGRLDLEPDYKERKLKKHGKIYPILRASDKMYSDIKYFMGVAKGAWQSRKIQLAWGFKTKRSERIAGYHHKGIKTKKGIKVRSPWFFTSGERSHITRKLKEATKVALRKARLKTI